MLTRADALHRSETSIEISVEAMEVHLGLARV